MKSMIKIINPISFHHWNDWVMGHEDYSFFHSSHWASVLCETYGFEPTYFCLFQDSDLMALLPAMKIDSFLTGRRGVSLPFSDYCPGLGNHTHVTRLIESMTKHGRDSRWKYMELRGDRGVAEDAQPSTVYHGHTLHLSRTEEEIFASLKSSTRRNIKKAIREGVTVNISHSLEALRTFYRLNCLTRRNHGLPPQPWAFFKNIHDHVIEQKQGLVVSASHENRTVAASVYFHFGQKAVYKFGASDNRFQQLRGNNLVMWEAIKWFNANSFTQFCFGRTELENQGLRQFKLGWGTEENLLKYYKYDFKKGDLVKDSPGVAKVHQVAFSRMPIPLLSMVGSALYRHMG